MNIFHHMARQDLQKNRSRTFVTIVGVMLSAALFTAIITFAVSLQSYMLNGATQKYGDWHVSFPQVNAAFIQAQKENPATQAILSLQNIGYAPLEGSQNPHKPYLFLSGWTPEAFAKLPITLLSGRLPQNASEVIIPAHIATNGGVKLSIGDTLTLSLSQRIQGGQTLSQHSPYISSETLQPFVEKTYTIVGICARPVFEEYSSPGYTVITAIDNSLGYDNQTAFVTLKNPYTSRSYANICQPDGDYILNDDVLRFLGIASGQPLNLAIFITGILLLALTMLGSIFLIYNAFGISLNERIHQFGMLMSIGATAKQLRGQVLFEGLSIGAIGIPLGILIGIPGISLVMALVRKNFANVLYDTVPLTVKLSPLALLIAGGISLVTILISAYIPAKKAATMPLMTCIRQTDEAKPSANGPFIFPQTGHTDHLALSLALKNFKRYKKCYRSVILSLTLSMVLLTSAGTLHALLNQVTANTTLSTDYDISLGTLSMTDEDLLTLYAQLKTVDSVTDSLYQTVLQDTCTISVNQLSPTLRQILLLAPEATNADLTVYIQFLEDTAYQNIRQSLALPMPDNSGHAILLMAVAKINASPTQSDNMFCTDTLTLHLPPSSVGQTPANLHLTLTQTTPPDMPLPLATENTITPPYTFQILAPWSLKEILPQTTATIYIKGLTFRSDNPQKSTAQMQTILESSGVTAEYTLQNVHAIPDQNRNLLFIVDLFTIVFIIIISLIAIANVFNTISTNIHLRRRELAMLRSIGMGDRDFRQMIGLECSFYGIRTLLYAIPLSLLAILLIFYGLMLYDDPAVTFTFPWPSLLFSILGIFLIFLTTTLYATSQIQKENIIDALRDELT